MKIMLSLYSFIANIALPLSTQYTVCGRPLVTGQKGRWWYPSDQEILEQWAPSH